MSLIKTSELTERLVGIYGFQNKLDPSRWYIGQGAGKNGIYGRWDSYEKLRCRGQPKFYTALLECGYDNFEKRIIELCNADIPRDMLNLKETAWIKHFNSVEHGYNIRENGTSISKETKMKISESLKGRKRAPFTDKARKNMSLCKQGQNNYWFGKTLSSDHKAKLSKANLGKKLILTPEERQKRVERAIRWNMIKKLKKLSNIDNSIAST